MALTRDFLADLKELLRAGFPITEALQQIQQASSGKHGALAARLEASIRGGSTLAEALMSSPRLFSRETCSWVRAGEASGKLDQVLTSIVTSLDRRRELRDRVLKKLAYPLFVLCFALIILPLPMIVQRGGLAYLTLEVSVFGGIALCAALVLVLRQQLRSRAALQASWERALSRLPVLGGWAQDAAIGKAYTLLGLSLEAGVSISEALSLASTGAPWAGLGEELRAVEASLRAGRSLADAFGATKMLGSRGGEVARLAVAEKAGRLEQTLHELGAHLEDRVLARVEASLKLAALSILPIVGVLVFLRLFGALGGAGGLLP